jgi:hypothetical protein
MLTDSHMPKLIHRKDVKPDKLVLVRKR